MIKIVFQVLESLRSYISKNAAIIIALSAVFISFVQLILLRKHYRLSVRPEIDGCTTAQDNELTVYEKNVGLGPAKINKYSLSIDGEVVELKGFDWAGYFKKHEIKSDGVYSEVLSPPCILSVNEKWIIFSLKAKPPHKYSNDDKERFRNLVKKMNLRIHFESMYKEKRTFDIGLFG